jgi:hypothetical protein
MSRAVVDHLELAETALSDAIEAVALAQALAGRTPLGNALRGLHADLSTQRRRTRNMLNIARGLSIGDDDGPVAA